MARLSEGHQRSRFGATLFAVATLIVGLVGAQACDDGDTGKTPPLPTGSGGGGVGGHYVGGPCDEGSEQACHVELGTHGGVVDCFEGKQVCENGKWSACEEGKVSSHRLPPRQVEDKGGWHLESLSSAGPCLTDPCDPSCAVYDEQPDGGPITPDPSPGSVKWQTGSLGDLPPGELGKGQNQPCHSADDCQFDEYCNAPYSGSCTHDMCDTGQALVDTCDGNTISCVAQVCDDPGSAHCCAYGGSCGHDPCSTGAKLTPSCDACVAQICGDPGGESCATAADCGSGNCQNIQGTCSVGGGNCMTSPCGAATGTCNQVGACSVGGAACTGAGSACDRGTCSHKVCSVDGTTTCTTIGASCRPGVCQADHKCSSDNTACGTPGNACGASGSCTRICSSDGTQCAAAAAFGAACGTGVCQNVSGKCSTDNSACGSSPCGPATGSCQNIHGTCASSGGSNPSCCSAVGSWDASCATAYAACSGVACQNRTWDASCTQAVHDVCGAFCESNSPGCSHDECDVGGALTAGCNSCVATVCTADPACCQSSGRQWDAQCVAEVSQLCGFECPVKGQCVPWLPKQTDPDCSSANLTVGATCSGTIPICNRGQTAVPAGAQLVHFPANSGQFGKCAPDLATAVTCTTTQPILPGTCIDMTTCAGLTNGREIMINPAGAGHVAECNDRCDDNWSIYNDGSCNVPACSGLATHATLKKVSMFVTVDKSGSMNDPNRWNPAMAALKSFFQDPSSAGLGVALRFWPDTIPSNCDSPSCSFTNCSQPAVALGTLTAASAPADAQEQALVASINAHAPGGGTPMYAALGGAEQWATNYAGTHPNEKTVVVMITDGNPTSCDTNTNDIAGLAQAANQAAGVETYVIGIAGVSQATINQIASAGGGQAFFIASGGNTQGELLAAMNAIRGQPVSCSFPLPAAGSFDPSNVRVTYTSSGNTSTNEPEVNDAGNCGSGWYYDDNSNPSTITLCPSTCATVVGDSGASVDVVLGCPTPYDPKTYTEVYEGDCDAGQNVQWGFLAYKTHTPGTSSINIEAQTGKTNGAWGTLTQLANAHASPDTQNCPMGGPSPCPIDVYNALGLPDATNKYLQLVFTLTPSADKLSAPQLESWDLTYTCVDSQ